MMDSGHQNKRSRNERGQFLFVEMFGELFGIDLSGYNGSSSEMTSPAPISTVTRCRLDLHENNFPYNMCHVKMGDKHYMLGGLKGNLRNYSDEVYELDADLCRISRDIICDAKQVLKPVPATRLLEPKLAKAFILKGKIYLHHVSQICRRLPSRLFVPFERLDVNGDIAADADTAPPFSCHKVSTFSLHPPAHTLFVADDSHHKVSAYSLHPSALTLFVADDKLVLFCCDVYIFTPDDDDSGDGNWSCLPLEDTPESIFDSFTGSAPQYGIFLSEFRLPDPDDVNESLGVLLSFDSIVYSDKCKEAEGSSDEFLVNSDEVCAYAISRETFKPKYYQKLDGVLCDLTPDVDFIKDYFLEDLGKGDEEGARRMCAIMTATDYDTLISYLLVSIFDVQLIQPPDVQLSQPGPCEFLKVFPPIKKLIFRVDMNEKFKFKFSHEVNAFLV